MEKSVRIDGIDYPLVTVANDWVHWLKKYHIISCIAGHVAGDYRVDSGKFHNVACWKFIRPLPPEKPKKNKYRPYNNDELEKLYQSSASLTHSVTDRSGLVTGVDPNNKSVFVAGEWVSAESLMAVWDHKDGTKCCVEFVHND